MTYPTYTKQQLEVKTLSELKSLYAELGCTRQVADKRSKESWALAIVRYQEEQAVKIEPKTCSDCLQFDSERGCCKLFNMVAKPHWQMTNDCVSEMECVNTDTSNDNINIPAELTSAAQQPSSNECVTNDEAINDIDVAVLEAPQEQPFVDANHEAAVEVGFVFTQETRGESLFWCGRLEKFHTGYFPELSTAAKFAVKYLSSPLHDRHKREALNPPIDTSKCKSAKDEAFDLDDEETAFVQSGDISFKEVSSTTYNVFNKGLQVGVATLNQGRWAIGINNERYATPYLAAAALVEFQLKLELLDKPITELTQSQWTGLKQTVSAEVEGQIEELLEECEVDGKPDREFSTLYRLWHGMKLLGTFYRPVFSDKWLARPSSGNGVFDGDTEEDARYWLAYAYITGDCSGDKSIKPKLQVVAA
jgi:hypothetical protein